MSRIAVFLTALYLSGCAAIFNNESEQTRLLSEPEGARVFIDGKPAGRTPTTASLLSDKTHSIEFQKEGYESQAVTLNYHVGAGWLIIDIILLPALLPIIIDGATGAWYELDEAEVKVVLHPQSPTPPPSQPHPAE